MRVHDEVLGLFIELGAHDSQIDFPTIYAIGRTGVAKKSLTDDSKDLTPLLDTILEHVPPANKDSNAPLTAQVFNLSYDNFLGRLAVARIYDGTIKDGQNVWIKDVSGKSFTGKVTKLFTFDGKKRLEVPQAESGDIITVAGIPDIYIGETIADSEATAALTA